MNNQYTLRNNALAFNNGYNRQTTLSDIQTSTVDHSNAEQLLEALKELSRLNKWIFITHTADIPERSILEAAGIDLSKLVVLKESSSLSDLEVINKALCANTASAIISAKPKRHKDALSVLQHAAEFTTKVMFTNSSVCLH
jgi:cell division inhibitor SulA